MLRDDITESGVLDHGQEIRSSYWDYRTAIEDTSQEGSSRFDRLPETGILADNLDKMYGSNCLSLTGLQANKADFLSKIAPTINQYGSVVL